MKNFIAFGLGLCALMIIAVSLSSCGSFKQTPVPASEQVTITKSTIERDTVLVAPGAYTSIEIPFEALTEAVSSKSPIVYHDRKSSKQATVTASLNSEGLKVDCLCDSMKIATKLFDRFENERYVKTIQLPPIELKYIPWYMYVLSGIGFVAAGFLLWMLAKVTPKR